MQLPSNQVTVLHLSLSHLLLNTAYIIYRCALNDESHRNEIIESYQPNCRMLQLRIVLR